MHVSTASRHSASQSIPQVPVGAVHVGTSGWTYRHWQGVFYPADVPTTEYLSYYASKFSSVEVNAPFYRLPSAHTVQAWRERTPPGFSFAVKASRYITHNKKLLDPDEPLKRFFSIMSHLEDRLSVVLFQLPPRLRFQAERLERFLEAYRRIAPKIRCCFEFRDPSWYDESALALLRHHRAGFCIYHLGDHQSPLAVTSDFAYVRLHGTHGRYAGAYLPQQLDTWAQRIELWRKDGLDVFCYFDNDIRGQAPTDAHQLRSRLSPD